MANPTDNAINLIRGYVNTSISGGFSNTDIYLTTRLNDPAYTPNPVAPGYVFTDFQSRNVFTLISASSVKNVLDSPGTAVALLPLLNTLPHTEENIFFLNTWAQAYEVAQVITPSEYVSITGVINQMIIDPTWQSGISWSQVYLNRSVDLSDIEVCR